MIEDNFSLNEKKLLSLGSKSYKARMKYKKMNRNNLMCSLKCNTEEPQLHIFQSCRPIIDKLGLIEIPSFNLIFWAEIMIWRITMRTPGAKLCYYNVDPEQKFLITIQKPAKKMSRDLKGIATI